MTPNEAGNTILFFFFFFFPVQTVTCLGGKLQRLTRLYKINRNSESTVSGSNGVKDLIMIFLHFVTFYVIIVT